MANQKIAEIIGDVNGKRLKKAAPHVVSYVESFYNLDEYLFELEKNDNELTISTDGERKCHVMSHIIENRDEAIKFCLKKIGDAYKKNPNGTFTPTWFSDKETASNILEKFLISSSRYESDRRLLDEWARNKDVNYRDKQEKRFAVTIYSKSVTGYGIVAGTERGRIFECHGARIVMEYTQFPGHGGFAIYDMYPCHTKKDFALIEAAKAEWRAKSKKRQ